MDSDVCFRHVRRRAQARVSTRVYDTCLDTHCYGRVLRKFRDVCTSGTDAISAVNVTTPAPTPWLFDAPTVSPNDVWPPQHPDTNPMALRPSVWPERMLFSGVAWRTASAKGHSGWAGSEKGLVPERDPTFCI